MSDYQGFPESNPVVGSPNLATGEVEYSSYGYNIHKGVAIFFVVAFGLSAIVHLFQAVRSRRWFLLYTIVLGTLLESFGWGMRLFSSESTVWATQFGGYWNSSDTAFLAQISVLIFSPAFIIASCYIILGSIIRRVGTEYSYLHPTTYTIIFVLGDLVSLIVQAIGGGTASAAETNEEANNGAKIMVGGVIFQMVVMSAFTLLLVSFTFNYLRRKPVRQITPFSFIVRPIRARRAAKRGGPPASHEEEKKAELGVQEKKKVELQLIGLAGTTLFIFIRSIYRTIELLDGWTGEIIRDQTLFDVLDGAMILTCVICLNIFHPLFFLNRPGSGLNTGDSEKLPLSNESPTFSPVAQHSQLDSSRASRPVAR